MDFALETVQRLNATGAVAQYVDPPDDLGWHGLNEFKMSGAKGRRSPSN